MKIQSVLGPVDSGKLGQTLAHEHIVCLDWSMRMNFGLKYFDFDWAAETGSAMLKRARKEWGIQTLVDGTPINLGRDVRLLAEVSRRSGVNIIASSGFYYQEEPCLIGRSAGELEGWLDQECAEGIDGTGILPGILKSAVGADGVTPMLRNVLTAVGRVSARRQLPVFCHHDVKARSGMDILDVFESARTDLRRVILGHSGDTDDCDYLLSMLRRGSFLGMDRFAYCDVTLSLEKRVQVIMELFRQGYGKQLLLSHDYGVYMGFQGTMEDEKQKDHENCEVDYTFIHRKVLPALKDSGLTEQEIHLLMVENPRRLLAGESVNSGDIPRNV